MNKEYIHIDTKTDDPLQNQIINIRKQQIKEEKEFEIHEFINQKLKEKDKEIKRLNNEIKTLLKENSNKEKVIIKQNNIINELERYINEEYVYDELGMKIFDASKLQDKLQELKGSEDND